jgi:hypothetical protein
VNIEDVLARLDKVKGSAARGWSSICPAHDDKSPSLSIALGDDGRVLLKCHAGCSVEEIVHAIGTIVRHKAAGRTITRLLTSGDGYQASNQRQLIFGLGSAEKIDQLEIRWPSGAKQTFTDVPLDSQCIAVQGREMLFPIDVSVGK